MKTKFIFFGEAFKKDNIQFWKILELNLLDTPGYNHIIPYEAKLDGRNAYLSLINFYEGEDFTTRLVDQAFGKLQAARYRGETTKFTFENFVNIHLKAHKMLVEAKYGTNGLGLDDTMKKQYLKQGITEEAGLDMALSTFRSNARNYKTFEQQTSFLKAEVDAKIARRAQLKTGKQTNVSSINKQGERRSQRSSNRRNKTILRQRVDGKIVEGRSYETTEWRKLTENQQKVVKDLRRKRGQSGKTHSAGKAVKSVRFNNEIESMLGQTLIAGIDAIKKKGKRGSTSSDSEEEGTRPGASRPERTMTSSSEVGNFLKKRRQGGSEA